MFENWSEGKRAGGKIRWRRAGGGKQDGDAGKGKEMKTQRNRVFREKRRQSNDTA